MYTISIMGAGKGSFQKVKKILKDHGIYEPNNCKYHKDEKAFRFEPLNAETLGALTAVVEGEGLTVTSDTIGDIVQQAAQERSRESAELPQRVQRAEDKSDQVMLDLSALEQRVESVDKGVAAALRAIAVFFDDVLAVIDPTTDNEDKASALIRARKLVALLKGQEDA